MPEEIRLWRVGDYDQLREIACVLGQISSLKSRDTNPIAREAKQGTGTRASQSPGVRVWGLPSYLVQMGGGGAEFLPASCQDSGQTAAVLRT